MIYVDAEAPAISWISLSSIAVLFTTGVAWGHLRSRVQALEDQAERIEQQDPVSRQEFNLLRDVITAIREDVREIRRKVQ